MVAAEVHVQQLFLSKGLLTVATGVRLLAGVGALVHYHVALLLPTYSKASYNSVCIFITSSNIPY